VAARTRTVRMVVDVTQGEKEMIQTKMLQLGTGNFGAYARKMLIDGYIIKKDYSELKKLTAELGKIGSNINQLAKRANETRHVSGDDIRNITIKQYEIERLVKVALAKLI